MRTITHGDIVAAATAILGLPPETGRAAVRRFLVQAHAADLFRKRLGRAHPFWGNGSLTAAACGETGRRGEPFLSDPFYLEAMALVIEVVLDWRRSAARSRGS